MRKQQRLVVCLDGTWNKQDDSTNVLHHFSLVVEGDVSIGSSPPVTQKKFYHPGVGTGVLDGLTGGGFGFGLEANVRAAYNWLVQNFQEGDAENEPDEIYIFGFSRGAYTARSLVGFISRCGLLRRAAPLTVNQLWDYYCLLGREQEERKNIWDLAFGETPAHIRQITELICDPWQTKLASPLDILTDVSGIRGENLNETELLLVRWSRRVRITFLGLYDTVGAMGFDALAIPGLKSQLALHHNMRATTLIQSCRHALALNEHRTSFSHTPFLTYVGHESGEEEIERGDATGAGQLKTATTPAEKAKIYWKRTLAMWWRKIEQRWFVGAHSNIGGGYADNRLAQRPFEWVLAGASAQGLVCEPVALVPALNITLPPPRDSYAEFARPLWTMILRGKRYYRPIDPEPQSQASHKSAPDPDQPVAGFSLQTINEQIDPSVFEYWQQSKLDIPPNLHEYARRKIARKMPEENLAPLKAIAKKPLRHPWLGDKFLPYLALVLWATFAAAGLAALHGLVQPKAEAALPIWLLIALAFLFPFVDWIESRSSFLLAAGRVAEAGRAAVDGIYWTRALGTMLFVIGLATSLVAYLKLGWRLEHLSDLWASVMDFISRWWLIPIGAGVGCLLATLLDGSSRRRLCMAIASLAGGPLFVAIATLLIAIISYSTGHIFAPFFGEFAAVATPAPAGHAATFAGLLMLLQFGVLYQMRALTWCGEPTAQANLGSGLRLQFCYTPDSVHKFLEQWRRKLVCRWLEEDQIKGQAAERLRSVLREALWRDIVGFVPVYSVVLGFGLWFAAQHLGWQWLQTNILGIPLWLLWPIVTAIADYTENACHLRYLSLHAQSLLPSTSLTRLSCTISMFKLVGFLAALGMTLATIGLGSWQVALAGREAGWRGTVVILISLLSVTILGVLVIGSIVYRCSKRYQAKTTSPH